MVDAQSHAGGGPAMSKFEVLTATGIRRPSRMRPSTSPSSRSGLGGRWDATNVINAPVAVITPISVDHVEYLGADIAGIAGEKAGIIHKAADGAPDTVAVIGTSGARGDGGGVGPDRARRRRRRP